MQKYSNALLIIPFLLVLLNSWFHFMDNYLCAILTFVMLVISLILAKRQFTKKEFKDKAVVNSGLYLMIVSGTFGSWYEIILKITGIGLLIYMAYMRNIE